MRGRYRGFAPLLAALLVASSPTPTLAQNHAGSLGLILGGSVNGNLTPDLPVTTEFESGWVVGLQYERWLGAGRTGIRLNTLFTQRLVDTQPGGDYNVFMGDLDVLYRVLPPENGRRVIPFLAAGLGATHYGSVAGSGPLAGGIYGENVVRPHVLASIGADVPMSRGLGARVELGDKIVLPSVGYGPSFSGIPNVHNLIVTVGLQYHMGRRGSDIEPRPARPTEPRPQPAREPEPPTPEPQPDARRVGELRAEVARLQSRIAELQALVDSLRGRIDELETTPEPAPDPVENRALYTVQVSSFLDSDRADELVSELRADGIPAWRWDAVTQNRTFSRVRVGALPTLGQAERLAEILHREKGLAFWVDRIELVEDVPPDAVTRTREYLEAGHR